MRLGFFVKEKGRAGFEGSLRFGVRAVLTDETEAEAKATCLSDYP